MNASIAHGRSIGRSNISGLRSLSETVAQVTHPLIGDRRVPLADLRVAWCEIVGRRLAELCQPHRLVMPPRQRTNGTLHLQVASGAVAIELQHQAPLLMQRINSCLGYAAVARLKLVHAPCPTRHQRRSLPAFPAFAPAAATPRRLPPYRLTASPIRDYARRSPGSPIASPVAIRRHRPPGSCARLSGLYRIAIVPQHLVSKR
ncbi:DUF721 domain-containing protein [Defluviicoccus vanus]|nr:DUF721 domain-containing protein [Defluviicoccus vanus]